MNEAGPTGQVRRNRTRDTPRGSTQPLIGVALACLRRVHPPRSGWIWLRQRRSTTSPKHEVLYFASGFGSRVFECMQSMLEPVLIGVGGHVVTHLLPSRVLLASLFSQVLHLHGGLVECLCELGCVRRAHLHVPSKQVREEPAEFG